MGKLEDRVNEILGVESKPNAELMQQKEYKPPVVREEDKEKHGSEEWNVLLSIRTHCLCNDAVFNEIDSTFSDMRYSAWH